MSEIILTFNMVQLNKDTGDCIAVLNGEETIVDPYVGCVWDYPYFKAGKATFIGHWHQSHEDKEKVFLPYKQLQDTEEQLCASCQKKLL